MTPEERYLRDLQIEGGLRELGLEHEPPAGWEERVFEQAAKQRRSWWAVTACKVVGFIAWITLIAIAHGVPACYREAQLIAIASAIGVCMAGAQPRPLSGAWS